jgi:hypothetical protein
MKQPYRRRRLREMLDRVRRLFRREPEPGSPEDPYAMVGAPKKPRPPYRSAAAAEPLE